jgi:[ribosomal protein S5]-alanine N-acetyltransferase
MQMINPAFGSYPVLTTRRFQFRPFALSDIRPLVLMAGEHRVSDTSIGVPHPYTAEFARMWIASHATEWQARSALHWAVTNEASGVDQQILGYLGLHRIDHVRHQAEARFWVGAGVDHFGFAREWLEGLVEFAVSRLNLRRIYALQIARHPLAGRVLAAIGMQQEGLTRKRIYKEGLIEDVIVWSIMKEEWQALPSAAEAPARTNSVLSGFLG